MSLWLKVLAALLVIAGSGFLVCGVGWCVAARRDRDVEQLETPESDPLAGTCGHGVGVWDDCRACRRAEGPTVVAGSDLEWQVSLDRMRRELDALLAYGEER